MKHPINILTLGVTNPELLKTWYEETLGWKCSRDKDGTICFRLQNMLLVFIQVRELARKLHVWEQVSGFKPFTLTIGFDSEKEVDRTFEELRKKQVTIIKQPEKIQGGIYKGYIADPEDNYLELAFHPVMENFEILVPIAIGREIEKFDHSRNFPTNY
jgi:catechol 2,3-dioxygenase-like lactoylglutathione lyase family enzyme